MGLISLMRMISTSKPRYVTIDGQVISGRDVQSFNGHTTHPRHGPVTHVPRHADHGGPDPANVAPAFEGAAAWWTQWPERLARERQAMAVCFPGFQQIVRSGRPGWTGTINTGYGRFRVEIVHRPDLRALPEARVMAGAWSGRRAADTAGRNTCSTAGPSATREMRISSLSTATTQSPSLHGSPTG